MARKRPQRPAPGQKSATQAKREARAAQRAEDAAAAASAAQAARRKERNAAILKLGLIGAVVLALVFVLVVLPWLRDRAQEERIKDLPLEGIGASPSAAGCGPVTSEKAVPPKDGWHVEDDTELDYDTAPPAYGKHWATFLQASAYRTIFSAGDRPAKEQLVHSLEHGHTLVWYDETIADDSEQLGDLEEIAQELTYDDGVVIVPWSTSGDDADGSPFPGGAHLAMTHWTAETTYGTGVWQYCNGVSGDALKAFMIAYPKSDSTEPDAP